MNDENKQLDNKPETDQAEAGSDKTKDIEKLERLWKDSTKREAKYREQYETLKRAQEEAAAASEKKKLEEAGQYEQLLKKAQAEYESKLAAYQGEILKRDVKDQLRANGAADEVFIDWAVDRFAGPSEEIGDYIKMLKEDPKHSARFEIESSRNAIGQVAPPSVKPGPGKNPSLDDRLKSPDKQTKKAAVSELFRGVLSGQITP